MNSSILKVFIFLIAVAFIAALSCFFCLRIMNADKDEKDSHLWIHHQIQITPEQDEALEKIEQYYAEQKTHLVEVIRLANMELGQAMLTDRNYSPHVEEILNKIQQAQLELQKITLRHVFEMKPYLSKEQYDKLLNLTANALFTYPE